MVRHGPVDARTGASTRSLPGVAPEPQPSQGRPAAGEHPAQMAAHAALASAGQAPVSELVRARAAARRPASLLVACIVLHSVWKQPRLAGLVRHQGMP